MPFLRGDERNAPLEFTEGQAALPSFLNTSISTLRQISYNPHVWRLPLCSFWLHLYALNSSICWEVGKLPT